MPESTSLLVLPAEDLLEPAQRAAVDAFRARGGTVLPADPARVLPAARSLPLPAHLDAPPRVQSHWFRGPDGSLFIALSNAPAWVLDPGASAPPPVTGARLLLTDPSLPVHVHTGAELPPSGAVPTFQEGLVLEVGTQPAHRLHHSLFANSVRPCH